ncbi:4-carboxymuconolactone decarboxylase [Penicillium hetheringtonii]|uniref:4-carboxymuconolactone decarboxylase n=1 Tax=Penicillium hetheringtonii TaxID=911720 RepID=A0AAD6H116_9EURO|nr:4-carboxymuconolactone decarboxylase [Penicillium hetheringtonii]
MSTDPKFNDLHKQLFEEGLKVSTRSRWRFLRGKGIRERLNRVLETRTRAGYRMGLGNIWTRPGLERRDRSLLNIGMLMALNRGPELGIHLRGARNNGLSELEIREAIMHASVYCGAPAGVDAFKIAERVFNEMAANGEMPRELGSKAQS